MPVSMAARAVYAAMRSPGVKRVLKSVGGTIGSAGGRVLTAAQRSKNSATIARKTLGTAARKTASVAKTTATGAGVTARSTGRVAKEVVKKIPGTSKNLATYGVATSAAKTGIKKAGEESGTIPAFVKSISQQRKNAQTIDRKKLGLKKFSKKKNGK